MYNLIYSPLADEDLTAIYNYIATDSPARASAYMDKMEQSILKLRDFPNMGAEGRYPELINLGVKVLPFDDYLIFYTVNAAAEQVRIVRVLHGSVNYRRLLKNFDTTDNVVFDNYNI